MMEQRQDQVMYSGVAARGMGSVQRARERAERDMFMRNGGPVMLEQRPSAPQQPGTLQNFSRTQPGKNQSRSPPRTASSGAGIGLAITQPVALRQWPLDEPRIRSSTREYSNPQIRRPPGAGRPPQRPSRPGQVPAVREPYEQPSLPQPFAPKSQQESNGDLQAAHQALAPQQLMALSNQASPILAPQSLASRVSTVSSTGSIPDFPASIPMLATTNFGKRPGYHGPPPTIRRGVSSYYSNGSFVSPVPEESPRSYSQGTYASSSVMPKTWHERPPADEVVGGDADSMYRTFPTAPLSSTITIHGSVSDTAPSAIMGNYRHREPLLHKATTDVNNGNGLSQNRIRSTHGGKSVGIDTAYHIDGRLQTTPHPWQGRNEPASPLASGTGLIDSSASSEEESPAAQKSVTSPHQVSDRRIAGMLGAYAAASMPRRSWSESPASETKSPTSVPPKHPNLDMRAAREPEARGSLTSLPELIRRATRLVALIDSGKRPGSRLNNLDDPEEADDKERDLEKRFSDDSKRPYSGLSGMLASFPPPGLSAPVTRDGLPPSRGTEPVVANQKRMDVHFPLARPLNRRRCCGLSLAWIATLAFVLFIVSLIAIIVPVEILVLHRPASTAFSSLSSCQASMKCQNGGTNIVVDGMCACICENGFTGSTCMVPGLTGCTTTSFTSSAAVAYTNSTIGDAIPRLFTLAQSIAVPLEYETVLARFNAAGLACVSENALVTFDGLSGLLTSNTTTTWAATATPVAMAAVTQHRRYTGLTTISAITTQTLTSVNPTITFDALTSHSTTVTSFATLTASTSAPMSTTNPTSAFVVTQTTIDFARVAVLFVLQQVDLTSAIAAQNAMQVFIDKPGAFNLPQNVSLFAGGGATSANVDFVALSVSVGGVTVGGTGAGSADT